LNNVYAKWHDSPYITFIKNKTRDIYYKDVYLEYFNPWKEEVQINGTDGI